MVILTNSSYCTRSWLARSNAAVIIYTGTRREAKEVAEFVSTVIRIPVGYYHAGLPAEERARIQNAFLSRSTNIIVATNAFGMGIDRADVRQVIHFNLPGSLEAYYQQADAAGRNGGPAQATLMYDPQDRALQEFFINSSFVSSADMNAIYRAILRDFPNRHFRANSTVLETSTTLDEISAHSSLHPVQIKVGISGLERAGVLEHLGDTGTRMYFRQGVWDAEKIESAIHDSRIHIQHRWSQLERMILYAEANTCRRKIILQHFGDDGPADAQDCCDNCNALKTGRSQISKASVSNHNPPAAMGASLASQGEFQDMDLCARMALILLDCIQRSRIKLGKRKIAQILHGSKAHGIHIYHHDRNIYFSRLAAIRQRDIEEFIDQLISMRFLKTIGGEYPVISMTPAGEIALKEKKHIQLTLPSDISIETIIQKNEQLKAGGTVEYTEQLLNQGLSPEEIAQKRGLSIITIYGHFERLLVEGRINLEQILSLEEQRQIEAAIEKAGSEVSLISIQELLPGEIDFGMIRCVIVARKTGAHDCFAGEPGDRRFSK